MEDQNWDGIFLHNLIVDNKIIRAFEIIHAKKIMDNAVLWNKYLLSHDL